MRFTKHFLTAIASSFVLGAPVAFATLIPSESVNLNAADRAVVLERSCGRAGIRSDKVEAWRYLHDTRKIYVHVICAPYGTLAGVPAMKIADCNNGKGRWVCDLTMPAFRLKLSGRDVVLAYDERIAPEIAVEIATYASTVRSFNGFDVPAFPVGECSISDGHSIPFDGAINFDLRCDGYHASITRDCWEKKCRLFFTTFYEVIAKTSSDTSLERTREG